MIRDEAVIARRVWHSNGVDIAAGRIAQVATWGVVVDWSVNPRRRTFSWGGVYAVEDLLTVEPRPLD